MDARRLTVDVGTGLLAGARFLPSPNGDQRPPGAGVELVVVHGISLPPGEFSGDYVEDFFSNRLAIERHPFFREIELLRVSAHLYLRRDGRIVQFVPFHERAWHAGVSEYRSRGACNDFSVGIELEGTDELPYAPLQYELLAGSIQALARAYKSFDARAVVGHSDIAPGRKSDPGASFDWPLLRTLIDEATGNL